LYPEKLPFITKKALMSKESLEADNNRFIENVKYYIECYRIENVYVFGLK